MLKLKRKLLSEVIKHCFDELPNEACGILAGDSRSLRQAYKMANIDKSPVTFFMDPKEQLKVSKEIRGQGLEMLAIYHSHIGSPAYPSSRDVELALYPNVSYVIISFEESDEPSVRSFKISEGKISEEEVEIEDN